MHVNANGFGKSMLGAALFAAALAASSAQAVSLSNLSVAEGNGYTNVTVSATVTGGDASTVLQYTVKNLDGTTLGSVEGAAGESSAFIDLGSMPGFVTGKTYYYEVSVKGASPAVSATTSYINSGWNTNVYFSANATGPAYVNGEWQGTAPEIEANKFKIEGFGNVFQVTTEPVKRDANHPIVDIQCEAAIDSYYLLDDVTNDVAGAIGAISLVSNETEKTVSWMVLKNGENWVEAASDASLKELANYNLRVELDYNTNPAMMRYSVKKGAGAWVPLTVNNLEWVAATNNTITVSNICFAGKADVARFDAKISTKALMEVDGAEFTDINEALAEATAEKALFLHTNLSLDPTMLDDSDGAKALAKNGKTITVLEHAWKMKDGSKKTVELGDNTIEVKDEAFIAKIGTTDEADAYTDLTEALTAGANKTVIVVAENSPNINAESYKENVTLDLNGKTLYQNIGKGPLLTVTGGSLTIVDTCDDPGFLGVAESTLEVSGGTVIIDGVRFISESASYAISAVATGASVVISNGWFEGGFLASNSSTIDIYGGYFNEVAFDGESDGFTAYGGRFTQESSGAPEIAEDGYHFADFGVPPEVSGVTFNSEVVKEITSGGSTVKTTVWVAKDGVGNPEGTVQLPDTFVAAATVGAEEPEEVQTELNKSASYTSGTMKKWHCYVLGMESAATTETETDQGPYVSGSVDSDSSNIGFNMKTPAMVKAAESGCKVEYEVVEYGADGNPTGKTSGKVNYDETAKIVNPTDAVKYYKMKVYITPKQ